MSWNVCWPWGLTLPVSEVSQQDWVNSWGHRLRVKLVPKHFPPYLKEALLIDVWTPTDFMKRFRWKARYTSHAFIKKNANTSSPPWKKQFCGITSQYCLSKSQGTLTTQGGVFQSGVQRCATKFSGVQQIWELVCVLCHRACLPSEGSGKSSNKDNCLALAHSFSNLFQHVKCWPSRKHSFSLKPLLVSLDAFLNGVYVCMSALHWMWH